MYSEDAVSRLAALEAKAADISKRNATEYMTDLDEAPSHLSNYAVFARELTSGPIPLSQATGRWVDGVANGFARHEKFHSPVLLPARGVIVGGYRQRVAEAFCTD